MVGACRARLAVNSRTRPDSAGQNERRPLTTLVLVRGRLCWVAGQGFEPWKASADGFTVRRQGSLARAAVRTPCASMILPRAPRVPVPTGLTGNHGPQRSDSHSPCARTLPCSRTVIGHSFARRGSDTVRRATRVPQGGVSNGQLGSPLTTTRRRSRPGPGHHCRVRKLLTQNQGARRADPRPVRACERRTRGIYNSCYINGYGQPRTSSNLDPKTQGPDRDRLWLAIGLHRCDWGRSVGPVHRIHRGLGAALPVGHQVVGKYLDRIRSFPGVRPGNPLGYTINARSRPFTEDGPDTTG